MLIADWTVGPNWHHFELSIWNKSQCVAFFFFCNSNIFVTKCSKPERKLWFLKAFGHSWWQAPKYGYKWSTNVYVYRYGIHIKEVGNSQWNDPSSYIFLFLLVKRYGVISLPWLCLTFDFPIHRRHMNSSLQRCQWVHPVLSSEKQVPLFSAN